MAFNRPLDAATAEEVAKLFVECIVAPGYEPAALEKFAAKKNLRLLQIPAWETLARELELELKRFPAACWCRSRTATNWPRAI